MPKQKKKDFAWKKGSELSNDDYDPLGNVREVGFNKVADGLYADPTLRKKARRQQLFKKAPAKKGEVVIEESKSGLKEDYTPSNTKKLIEKEAREFKGIQRFKDISVSKKSDKDD